MQKIYNKVNFTLSYIGTPTANDGVECKHGAPECMGNVLELCAARLYPSPIKFLGFTMCMTETYADIPQRYLVEGCALEHGVDFEQVNKCISDDGGEGVDLLRDSVERSAESNVTKSCTVRVNGEVRCIRDGGQWKDCKGGSSVDELVRDIEKAYNGTTS